MSEAQKSYRVISATQAAVEKGNSHRVVNIIADTIASDTGKAIKTCKQVTQAPSSHECETVIAGATGTNASPPKSNGLQTILIAGYTGPQ